ncbi:mannosyl-oligosaccharide glucosidase-like [Tetranychus urticae]|uniref:Mannosyl-oligosaccharide glucosidase n=1 Tax=Tetranychus urticae TaxID=32264 RepID=T1K2H5_TETUR|nr:mannosyl-oligosaccharide glucosidase-like [Tetranychus urticae]
MSTKVTQRKKEKRNSPAIEEKAKKRGNQSSLKWLYVVVTSLCLLGLYYVNRSSHNDTKRLSGLNFSKRWGTFRSGVYFGLKRNEPSSVVSGMMWFKNVLNDDNSVPLRHWCSKFDPVTYYWKKHDFDSFGVQEIKDSELILKQEVLFREDGWIARINLNTSTGSFDEYVSVILYLATEADGDLITLTTPKSALKRSKKIDFEGNLINLENFLSRIEFSDSKAIVHIEDFRVHMHPPLMFFQEHILQNLGIIRAPDGGRLIVLRDPKAKQKGEPNFVAVQLVISKPVELFFYLRENSDPYLFDSWKNRFDGDLLEKIYHFDADFADVFQLRQKNYNDAQIDFAKSILSNMLGSIGYFYGHSFIKNGSSKPEPYGPLELVSAVPSRSYFPRGFLWDEGFHQLLIAKIKPELSRAMIKNWLNLMDKNGWIPREVILGFEAMSRVPNEFIVQDISNANPPSLFLPLEFLFDSGKLEKGYLKSIYPLLERWYGWFNTSQVGYKPGTYRWRGRDPKIIDKLNPLTLTSGLDDYPRASHPSDKEIHLDLRCWMTLASRILYKIGKFIEAPSAIKYEQAYNFLRDNRLLDETHWSEENEMYCDFGLHSNRVELEKVNGLPKRIVLEKPIYQCVPELGYISLFPMLLNLLDPDNPRLDAILSAVENTDHLWSPFGLRSISTKSRYYLKWNTFTDPPYWRGPIWININFLALKSLKYYSQVDGPYKERAKSLHDKLRDNLVNNIFREFERTNFIWEHYNDTSGEGGGVHPFTGWSALVILIMSDRY